MHKFSDFAQETALSGDKMKVAETLNKPLIIENFLVRPSKYHGGQEYTQVQGEFEGKEIVFFTGSSVLREQFNKYKEQLPFEATIKKIGKYYTLT